MKSRQSKAKPDKSWVFSTKEAIEYLDIDPKTFRKYRDRLGIEARKRYGFPGEYYTLWDLVKILDLYVVPKSLWSKTFKARLDAVKGMRGKR